MIVEILAGGGVSSVLVNGQDAVFVLELAQVGSSLVLVEAVDIGIEPQRLVSDGGAAFGLEGYLAYRVLAQ